MIQVPSLRPVVWLGSTLRDYRQFPDRVQSVMGYALYLAQLGGKHRNAKPLKGFRGAGVLEMVVDHAGDTYRCVYSVRFPHAVYALHAFMKKSKSGIATPRLDLEIIERRYREAERHAQER
jgi:phage-related protein